jgi:hypothetical protein
MGLRHIISRLCKPANDSTIAALATETGRRVAHQYLDCYRNLEQTYKRFSELPEDDRYAIVVTHILDTHHKVPKLMRDIEKRVLELLPNRISPMARTQVTQARQICEADNIPFAFFHVVLQGAITEFVYQHGTTYKLSSERIMHIATGIIDIIPEDM